METSIYYGMGLFFVIFSTIATIAGVVYFTHRGVKQTLKELEIGRRQEWIERA